jgi:hypothetical protein
MKEAHMIRAPKGGMGRWRIIVAMMAVPGFMPVLFLPVGAAQLGDDIEQNNRQANTPADYRALAAAYEQKAQAAQQLATRYFLMRDALAAARGMERKDRGGENYAFVAKKYQDMVKEYETFAAAHKMMAEQRQ